ncbi:MAG: hypothetical protein IT548_15415 [Alphaproteobacteria bacterium]|nr:hypothetical protein [Alphaproteobacteria bacterium]
MTIFTFGGGFYAGDVELNQGTVDGGNDTIRGSNFPFVNEILAGDVHTNAAEGFLTGGDDALFGRAGQDLLSGDVYRMKGGAVTGGADVIQGGEDSDIIAGDLLVMADPSTPVQINFTGGADRLFGDNGNDWIAGDIWDATGIAAGSTVKGGNDTLSGGAGDDTLLGDFGGSAGLAAQGGDDVLDGGAGADRLEGGAGNDTYINPTGDTIVEAFQPGIDTVKSDVSFSLAAIANVERLVLTGTAAINGNGNGLDNLITGNGAANTLRGLAGNDTLAGGAGADRLEGSIGDDTYVDPAGDTIVELAHQGIDTVQTAANFSLAAIAEVERLVLTGSADVNGTGNALANAITGNAGANALNGAAGNDTLTGGGGNDTLTGGGNDDLLNGGAGADLFRFSAASSGTDTIQGFSKTADHFDLGGAVFTAVSDITGDSVLTYSGGTIIVQAVAGLTLAQWNDLIIP